MHDNGWVLAITKRTADICATQPALYAAGFELATATNMTAARAAIKSLRVNAVIICLHSWSAEERERIASDLAEVRPKLSFVTHCPGCVDYDEAAGQAGRLTDTQLLTELISTISPVRS